MDYIAAGATGPPPTALSEQQLIDCTEGGVGGKYSEGGCVAGRSFAMGLVGLAPAPLLM